MNITPKKWASYTKGNNLLYPQRCLLYLRDGPPTPTEGFPVSIEEAFYAYRRLPMSTESLMCPQMASYARRMPCLTAAGLLFLQRTSSTYRGPPLPTEGPPIPRGDSYAYERVSPSHRESSFDH